VTVQGAPTNNNLVAMTIQSDGKLVLASGSGDFALVRLQGDDPPGATPGQAASHTSWLDDNAAGSGWLVEPTPGDDSEFTIPGNPSKQDRMELLTALAHQTGSRLGKGHGIGGVRRETPVPGVAPSSCHELLGAVDWLIADEVVDQQGH
jgi:hypothetical protein